MRETGNKKSDREAGFFCVMSAKQSQGGVVGCHRAHLRFLCEEEELLLRIAVLEFARGLCHVGAVARRRGGREVFFLRDEVRRLIIEALLRRADGRRLVERLVERRRDLVERVGDACVRAEVQRGFAVRVRQAERGRAHVAEVRDARRAVEGGDVRGLRAVEEVHAVVLDAGVVIERGDRLIDHLAEIAAVGVTVRAVGGIEERLLQLAERFDGSAYAAFRRFEHGVRALRIGIRLADGGDVRIHAHVDGIGGRSEYSGRVLRAARNLTREVVRCMVDAVQGRVLDEVVSECDRHEAAHPFVGDDMFIRIRLL